jgi:hypothetical protein
LTIFFKNATIIVIIYELYDIKGRDIDSRWLRLSKKTGGLKRMKKYLLFAALILIIAAGVFAQEMPGSNGSPTSSSTAGLFSSDADDFIDPSAFSDVTFDKFYAMASFAFANRAELGFAAKIGSVYLAAAYGGSFWANYTPLNYQEQKGAWSSDIDKKVPVYTFDAADPFDGIGTPENRIGILIGLTNMGIRFTFSSEGHEWIHLKKDFVDDSGLNLKSYDAERGSIVPQIAWAMAKPLTENGIQPYVVLDLGFVRDSIKYEEDGVSGTQVINSENHFDPALTVGLGGYTVYKTEGNFELSVDFEYQIGLEIYSNEYTYNDGVNLKTKTIKGTYDGSNYNEYFSSSHLITPSLSGSWSGGPLGLKFTLELPVEIVGDTSTPKQLNTDGDLEDVPGNKTTKTTTVGFHPSLALGAQWQILPDKLTLNAGGQISFDAGSIETSVNDGNKTVNEKNGVSTTEQFNVGITFNPTKNLSFDVTTGISITSFNFFNMNSFTNLLVSLKF